MSTPAFTRSTSFHPCNNDQTPLFAVRADVPLADGLEAASCLLASVLRTVFSAAVEHDDEVLHGAIFQLQAVKAVIDSADAAPALAPTIASLEALLQEAERLATIETGQAKAFNQGRASAFKLVLDAMRGVQS